MDAAGNADVEAWSLETWSHIIMILLQAFTSPSLQPNW